MMRIVVSVSFIALLSPVQGAVLVLQGEGFPGCESSPPDLYHSDPYHLPPPSDLLLLSPIVRMDVKLISRSSNPANHVMINSNPGGVPTPVRDATLVEVDWDCDTHLLFGPEQVRISGVLETETVFMATVEFIEPIDELPAPPPGADPDYMFFFLRTVNSEPNGDGETELSLRVTYADGTVRDFSGGIIPEPSRGLIALIGMAASVLRRGRERGRCLKS